MSFIVPSEDSLNHLLMQTFTSRFRKKYVNVNEFVLPERYLDVKSRIENFQVFDDDVWICGFPKTGTTWTSEIAWLVANNFDYEGAKVEDYKRTRMLEFSMLFDPDKEVMFGGEDYERDSITHAAVQNRPRTIKTHFPYSLLPKQIRDGTRKPRIICTARNPMDTCISYYHQCKNYEGFVGTLDELCQLFLFDKVNYGPYAAHVLSFWEQRNNLLFMTYEDLKRDIDGCITKIATYLGKTITFEQQTRLKEYVSFDKMKTNPAVNKQNVNNTIQTSGGTVHSSFIRSGKSGGYKTVMSPEMINQFKYWMGKKFQASGLDRQLNIID